jgi:hypothetical protein
LRVLEDLWGSSGLRSLRPDLFLAIAIQGAFFNFFWIPDPGS